MKSILIGIALAVIASNFIYAEQEQNILSDKEAFEKYKKSAENNDSGDIYNLAVCYMNGKGVKKDIKKALGYYTRAADLGDNRALERIKKDPLLKKDLELRIKGMDSAQKGDFDSAVDFFQKSVSFRKNALGKGHPAVATTYNSIGRFYYEMGNNTKALFYYQKSLNIRENTLGKKHNDTLQSYDNISFLYETIGNYSDALKYAKKILANESVSNIDIKNAYIYSRIGWLYEKYGDYPNALKYIQKAQSIQENILGEDHNETIGSYTDLSFIFSKIGNYQKALEYAKKSLPREKNISNKNNKFSIMKYSRIAWLFQKTGDYANAIKYTKKALSLQEKNSTTRNEDVARNYDQLSFLYQMTENYTEALKYSKKTLSIEEKVYGKEHKNTIRSLETISYLYKETGNFPEALIYAKKALNIKENIFGKNSINMIKNYSDLESLYESMEDYTNALVIAKNILELRKQYLSAEDKDMILSYNNLSYISTSLSQYSTALAYEKKALEINKKIFGEESLNAAHCYSRLGQINLWIENYSQALKYQKQALNIKETILDKEHEDIAESYINLGLVYQKLGNFSKALALYRKALAINEKKFGTNDLTTASSYISLGSIYLTMGNYSKALEYNQKALLATEKVLGKNNTATAVAYLHVAASYQTLGYFQKSSEYYNKALDIDKKVLGTESPAVASVYTGLGSLYTDMGDDFLALEYQQKALHITKVIFGKDHSFTSTNYYLVGSIYKKIKDYAGAYFNAQFAFDIFLKNRYKIFTILNSKQKNKYLKSTSGFITLLLQSAYSYIQELNKNGDSKKSKEILHSGANAWLNYKGSVFDSENTIAALYTSTKDKKLKAKIEDLISSKRYLAKLYQSLPKPKEKESWQNNIKKTEEKLNKLTHEISSKASILKEQEGLKNISYTDISSYLKTDELYVDYAKVENDYYLFSLDHKKNITFIQIDENSTKKIDNLIKAFREDILTIRKDTQITDEKLKSLTQRSKEKLSKLYELVIEKPLGDRLKNKTSLIISPDGALRLIPFETLYNQENDKYFIEEKEISYIPSGRELVRLYKYSKENKQKGKNKETVIFADPNFNTNLKSKERGSISITRNTSYSNITYALFSMGNFAQLPGTRAEANAIKSILGEGSTIEYLQDDASESNLTKVKQPNILHIATHGFFINDDTIPNPMLKSGIVLTGANKSRIKGKGDGIVTALKLSGLDLKGTDLVVLSACETGVVDINSTDSVSGLSKAFIQAGAKDIVMSLWSVDDQATKELMTSFYQEMKGTKEYAKALKAAKLKMIAERRHPFYWGAFVVSGL